MNTVVFWLDPELVELAPEVCSDAVDVWGVITLTLLVQFTEAAVKVVADWPASVLVVPEDEPVPAAVDGLARIVLPATAGATELEPPTNVLDWNWTKKFTPFTLMPPRLMWIVPGLGPVCRRFRGRTRTML